MQNTKPMMLNCLVKITWRSAAAAAGHQAFTKQRWGTWKTIIIERFLDNEALSNVKSRSLPNGNTLWHQLFSKSIVLKKMWQCWVTDIFHTEIKSRNRVAFCALFLVGLLCLCLFLTICSTRQVCYVMVRSLRIKTQFGWLTSCHAWVTSIKRDYKLN